MTSQNLSFKEVLEKIARVNAMDYEYQRWAREALAAQPAPTVQEPAECRVCSGAGVEFDDTNKTTPCPNCT
jgi:predicted nucleic acid-binding Zn ribbon protein